MPHYTSSDDLSLYYLEVKVLHVRQRLPQSPQGPPRSPPPLPGPPQPRRVMHHQRGIGIHPRGMECPQ